MDEMIDYVSNHFERSLRFIKRYALVLAAAKMVNEKITINSYVVKFIAVVA